MAMNTTTKNAKFGPDWVTPPGATLLEILEAKQMTQEEFAKRANLAPMYVNQMITGEAPITPETAILLEQIVGVSAQFWNSREADYQTRKAKLQSREKRLKKREVLVAR